MPLMYGGDAMLTVAISTHGGYVDYLQEAVDSALECAEVVVVYDDGGECFHPKGVRYVPLEKTGFCVLARQRAIEEVATDKLLHLDGDDYMIGRPAPVDCDWLVADLFVGGGDIWWTYEAREHTPQGAMRYVYEHFDTPICSKAVWDVDFLKRNNLSWYQWPSTTFAEDCRTEIEYLKYNPSIVYDPDNPFYGYRLHPDQDINNEGRRAAFVHDLREYLCR